MKRMLFNATQAEELRVAIVEGPPTAGGQTVEAPGIGGRMTPFILPIAIGILITLFMVQARGTASMARAFGPITTRKRSLQAKISQMDDQIANKERMLASKEVSLRNKFAKLEETMSRLKSQGGALSAMGGGGGGIPGLGG